VSFEPQKFGRRPNIHSAGRDMGLHSRNIYDVIRLCFFHLACNSETGAGTEFVMRLSASPGIGAGQMTKGRASKKSPPLAKP
jgi:hypothetical protein